uniref:Myosin XVB n=1 Tax=Podarcis muralis TaxID=64176 RepID=A0A670HY56_PODMU
MNFIAFYCFFFFPYIVLQHDFHRIRILSVFHGHSVSHLVHGPQWEPHVLLKWHDNKQIGLSGYIALPSILFFGGGDVFPNAHSRNAQLLVVILLCVRVFFPIQATDHTFLQKCHYHHANSPWYVKPKLPLPVFTVQHYAGPVTYQVYRNLQLKRGNVQGSTGISTCCSDVDIRCKLWGEPARYWFFSAAFLCLALVPFFIWLIETIPFKLQVPNVFDTEYVASQLRHSGILEAICIRKEGYPIRIPFRHFLIRYGVLAGRGQNCLQERDGCAAVLSQVVGDLSELYQIGVTKVVKRYQRLKKTLMRFGVAMLVSRPLTHKRRQYQVIGLLTIGNAIGNILFCYKVLFEGLCVTWLKVFPVVMYGSESHHHAQINQVTEVSPPEVKAKTDLSLPPDINSFPFSSFIRSHFQEVGFPSLGQPLQQPLTRLDGEQRQSALQLNKVILRFINDKDLQDWEEKLLGNYIASRGLASLSLRNELLSQVASQVWKNPDLEQGQRGCVLMAALLGSFAPSPALEKPLLKFVSDHGLDGYNGVCQRKLLMSMKQMESDPEVSRSFPPTQLEWTANQRKGKMVLDVYTYKEERLSAEVESWTTGEQYAGWILSSRGLDTVPRGWSVSMFTGKAWQDLPGCDFVLDLIGEIEEGNWPSESSPDYPITPEWDESYSYQTTIIIIKSLLLTSPLLDSALTVVEDGGIRTQLLGHSASVTFSYANPTWKLFLRKEVFYPKENFSHPCCLNLLCDQIMTDTYSESCIRISKEEKRKMKDLLGNSILDDGIKKRIVVAARDNWANYFSRLFPVKGENGSDVQILGVSHRGLRLLKRAKAASFNAEQLKTLCSYSYSDVLSLELMDRNTLQFSLKDEQLILHSRKARQIKTMVELFLLELKKDSNYVIALRSYVTDDKSLLSFKKGDFIQLLRMEGLEPGWQFGSVGGRSGLFPSSMVQPVAAPTYHSFHPNRTNRQEAVRKSLRRETQLERNISKEVRQAVRRRWRRCRQMILHFLSWVGENTLTGSRACGFERSVRKYRAPKEFCSGRERAYFFCYWKHM